MILSTIIIFILVLGLLVFVHELGHFITAKRSGINVEEFGFGLPPRLFGVKRGETIYSLNLLPIGGFVKIFGENGEEKTDERSFSAKSILCRAKILASGVFMNYLLAVILFSVAFTVGLPAIVEDGSGYVKDARIQITQVVSNSPAQKSGIAIGDQIVSLSVGGSQELVEVKEIIDVQKMVSKNVGKEVNVTIKRGDKTFVLDTIPRENPPEGEVALGIVLAKTALVSYPWYESLWRGFLFSITLTWEMISALFILASNFFRGSSGGFEVAGPVGIYQLTGQMSQLGINYLIHFVAFLNLNLAIVNILPFPALDGGRLLFLLIEKIKGKPINQKSERLANSIGLALLVLLMVFITYKDII
ncbi:MAG: RIP metalloprotease RseP, partial [Candidatus Portnoybacteria bacterium CG10_big_fil_rev_8_21_14_0_10_36_7]